jgi:glycine dehydrogenase
MADVTTQTAEYSGLDTFAPRHFGEDTTELAKMLKTVGAESLDDLVSQTVPPDILRREPLVLPKPASESEAIAELRGIAAKNRVLRTFIGRGYYGCHTPAVIQRNILENPGWYTAYTPYQAEIAQGRLEALVNFQQMICDLTGMEVANASLLDEGTAAAEAVAMAMGAHKASDEAGAVFVSAHCHPQTIAVVRTRCEPLGIAVIVGEPEEFAFQQKVFAVVTQYPDTRGFVHSPEAFIAKAHEHGATAIVATDPLALCQLVPPGRMGADVVVGTAQRFGVPQGFGGPHAGFLATRDSLKRLMPGRLVGVSKDSHGRPAYRLSLQTREQHIRRDKATSNICTAQVLLAVIASSYAVYHGPQRLAAIANRVHQSARALASALTKDGLILSSDSFFDTLLFETGSALAREELLAAALHRGLNLGSHGASGILVALDETVTPGDLRTIRSALTGCALDAPFPELLDVASATETAFPVALARPVDFLEHPVFNQYHTEHEMLRYLRRLEAKDLSLCHSMIALGSCTMKLNATSEMFPVTWPAFALPHPFAPEDQVTGYAEMAGQLCDWLARITGFAAVSLEPNAGSQGEYAGLLAIRRYQADRGQGHRDVCLIPTSAHGTNPASAVMAGMRVVTVRCQENGDIDIEDLKQRVAEDRESIAALMITYPSTHGVFETAVREICQIIHNAGGQVYMDGANMNAQVAITSPGDIGADVCHLNLHKTFCIPHGGGGPGVGPVCVAEHLAPYLPDARASRAFREAQGAGVGEAGAHFGAVSAAPVGSASILVIPWMFIRMMGADGLREATARAILNANYVAVRLRDFFPVLYTGANGRVAHECILDLRGFSKTTAEDVAKRLMDFGFHAPTLSWPVAGTLMVEPTESETLAELDRFCDAMIAIHREMSAVESGAMDPLDNPLKLAPHTAEAVTAESWTRSYSRTQAAFPASWVRERKFWPSVGRIDNVWGDRNLFCACVPVQDVK